MLLTYYYMMTPQRNKVTQNTQHYVFLIDEWLTMLKLLSRIGIEVLRYFGIEVL